MIWLLLLIPVAAVWLIVLFIQMRCGKSNRRFQEPLIYYMKQHHYMERFEAGGNEPVVLKRLPV
ncbi:hypothetical protein [Bacillus sp. 165]|uniref:hypothetical protein n=1 Tax=Bacillus sp. 165 TaxID=1529117 RepID=UPI001ADBDAE6|nr:hypothetical protein [Bacillus sp. 165]MBO9129707.1 hypothetical protein [Bacillus sp. 165]